MSTQIRIGIIGLDTSHVSAFTELLHNQHHAHHVSGGRVVIAYPGGSPDFPLSASRVEKFTRELRDLYGVEMVTDCAQVAERSDAILLESVDGRVHLEQFRQIVPYGKPVFIDKPFALSSREAAEIIELASAHGTPIMSCSALRFAEAFTVALQQDAGSTIIGCDTFGPMEIEPTQPGLFWYGIHCVEMLFAALGKDCVSVQAITTEQHDFIVAEWSDGRIGTFRGNRCGNHRFGGVLHRASSSTYFDISDAVKPYYASLLEQIIAFFRSGQAPIDIRETERIVRFIECANESRLTGHKVRLD